LVRRNEPSVRKPLTTTAELKAHFRASADARSVDSLAKRASDYVNLIEAEALEIYGRHGLPTRDGLYERPPEGWPWQPIAVAHEPGGDWIKVLPDRALDEPIDWDCRKLEFIGEGEFAADSEVGFATNLLARVRGARSVIEAAKQANDREALAAFHAGADLVQAYHNWFSEFALGHLIVPGRASLASLDRATGARREAGNPVRDAARADIVANPNTSQTACARRVVTALGGDQRNVERLIRELFDWRDLPGGGREKRPRQTDG